MARLIALVAGMVCMVPGIVLLPLPTPLGLPLILLGLLLVLWASPRARRWLRSWRRNHRQLSARIDATERWLPPAARKVLDETDP